MRVSKTVLLAGLSVLFLTGAAAQSETDWINKDAWEDTPDYAQDARLDFSSTDLIQKRESVKVCKEYNGSTDLDFECLNYNNQTRYTDNIALISVDSKGFDYLGNGTVRTNLKFSSTELGVQLLKEDAGLISESDFIKWFDSRYGYKKANITGSDVDSLQSKMYNLNLKQNKGEILDFKVESFEIVSLYPFKVEASTTAVIRFNNFKSGSMVLSDLYSVEVVS